MASAPIARRATALKAVTAKQSAVRRSIPSRFEGSLSTWRGETDEGLPGADIKNTGDDARLYSACVS